jgi:hypothetical protein
MSERNHMAKLGDIIEALGVEDAMSEKQAPERIYLEPEHTASPDVGRTWCEDDGNWIDEDGRYVDGTAYVRADIVGELEQEVERLRAGITEAQRDAWRDEVARIVWKLLASTGANWQHAHRLPISNAIDAIAGAGLRMLALAGPGEGGDMSEFCNNNTFMVRDGGPSPIMAGPGGFEVRMDGYHVVPSETYRALEQENEWLRLAARNIVNHNVITVYDHAGRKMVGFIAVVKTDHDALRRALAGPGKNRDIIVG